MNPSLKVNATVNAGLAGFVRAAACNYRGIRINLINPTVLSESVEAYDFFPVSPAYRPQRWYRRSVEGIQSGQFIVGY